MKELRLRGAMRAKAPAVGSLAIVGTGISIGQITAEARACIQDAECLLALVADPITLDWLSDTNPNTESLQRFYAPSKPRDLTYREMIEYTMSVIQRGRNVCLVLYGHPGVFAYPPHELMRRCRARGISARMLPGVSAEDCLFADLGIDPGRSGCQSFEATDFLLRCRRFDPTSALILWQFGITGDLAFPTEPRTHAVRYLARFLSKAYGLKHKVIIYEAAIYPPCMPMRFATTLASLPSAPYTPLSTLFVPPLPNRPINRRAASAIGVEV